jgi:hypothetical protein
VCGPGVALDSLWLKSSYNYNYVLYQNDEPRRIFFLETYFNKHLNTGGMGFTFHGPKLSPLIELKTVFQTFSASCKVKNLQEEEPEDNTAVEVGALEDPKYVTIKQYDFGDKYSDDKFGFDIRRYKIPELTMEQLEYQYWLAEPYDTEDGNVCLHPGRNDLLEFTSEKYIWIDQNLKTSRTGKYLGPMPLAFIYLVPVNNNDQDDQAAEVIVQALD